MYDMKNKETDEAILAYITNADGKLIPQRCVPNSIEKRGWTSYLLDRFCDNSTNSIAEAIYRLYNGIEELPKCGNPMCDERVKFNMSNKVIGTYCCPKCRNTSPEMIEKNKAGVSRAMKKVYQERGDEVKARRSSTLRARFGLESDSSSPFAVKDIRDRAQKTLEERYGVSNIFVTEESKEHMKSTMRNKSVELWKSRGFDIEYTDHDTIILKRGCDIHGDLEYSIVDFNIRVKPERLGLPDLCPFCNEFKYTTSAENVVAQEIEKYVEYDQNTRKVITPYELDFYIPSMSIGVEVNGVYFHSQAHGKPISYHKDKTELCEENGIRLIHIWEDDITHNNERDDKNKRHKFENKLRILFDKNVPTIDPYKTGMTIKDISMDTARTFVNSNSMRSFVTGEYRYGLYIGPKLCSVIVYDKFDMYGSHEDGVIHIVDYVDCIDAKYVNTFQALLVGTLQTFRNSGVREIVGEFGRDWFEHDMSEFDGMEFVGVTEPNCFYTKGWGERIYKRYSDTDSVYEDAKIMAENGYHYQCFDSGNLKFKYTL